MKKLLIPFLFLLSLSVHAQVYDPVQWQTEVIEKGDNTYDLVITATIEPGWHLYAQEVPEGGPIPTSFSFHSSEGVTLNGKVMEPEGTVIDDPVFEMKIKFFESEAVFTQQVTLSAPVSQINAEVEYMVCDDSRCLPPTYRDLVFTLPGVSSEAIATPAESPGITSSEKTTTVVEEVAGTTEDKSLWSIFIIAFFSGFAALLTPCVFPMIPLTVSFFTKQSKSRATGLRNAVFYGLSVIGIYVFLGSVVTALFGADSLNALSTNVWFNLFFFILLVIFALSFLGAFEITLPHSWASAVDAQSTKGGLIGIVFMALALAIVSFSCTGPIVGTLLVEAAAKGGSAPVVGMLGFSLALALPFGLFAAFPGWMNSLPKSGGWLNTVKVVLGFLELALAFKFLSNADLVLQLHLLERELFLAIWIAVFGALALYLFGFIKLPHDSPLQSLSVTRLSFGMLVTAFVIYLIPGLWGAPLKIISGFAPPLNYSEAPAGFTSAETGLASDKDLPPGGKWGVHQILTFTDYDDGLAYAKKVNKPILIDFTGHACVNCRKMEDNVWSDPAVRHILQNDVVLVSLYVDDKRKLEDDEVIVSEITGKPLRYIGQKWSEFQILRYNTNAQPYYVLTDHNGTTLHKPSAYNPNIEDYLTWLRTGIGAFESPGSNSLKADIDITSDYSINP